MDPDIPKRTRREAIIRILKAALVALVVLVVLAPYALAMYGKIAQGSWPVWSGFGDYVTPIVEDGQEFQRGITLWDLTQLLIIPIVLALAVVWFNRQERKTEREIAAKRDQTERELAADRIRENALQAYLDRMTELLLEKGLRESESDDEVRSVARARTLTVLRGLDPVRKAELVRFLYESRLISKENNVVNLSGADLHKADLLGVDLRKANLLGVDLSEANLMAARLDKADLSHVNLSRATMVWAKLDGAKLIEAHMNLADLSGAYLGDADLTYAELDGAKLVGAQLNRANLDRADLRNANMWDCRSWTREQLNAALSLEGAQLPEGYTPPKSVAE